MDGIARQDNKTTEVFCASSAPARLRKLRIQLWLSACVGVLIVNAGSVGKSNHWITSAIVTLAIVVLLDWYFRKKAQSNQASISISLEGIESSLLSGPTKNIPWRDIQKVTAEPVQGVPFLQLELAPSAGQADKRRFLTGENFSRPTINLGVFDAASQERIYDLVLQNINRIKGVTQATAHEETNPLTEERIFQERLISFAPIPWLTYALIALNAIIWLGTLWGGASIAGATPEQLLHWGGNAASALQHGDWWRLSTSNFLHNGAMHVAMNMLGLYSVGVTVERIYGHRQFALIYLGSGLLGSGLSLHFAAQHAVSIGASGAVFGVAGALLVGLLQHRHQLPKAFGKQSLRGIGIFIVYSLAYGLAKDGIDNAAHIGGLLGGCLLAFILPERFDMTVFEQRTKQRILVSIALTLAITAGMAVSAPTATVDQQQTYAGRAALISGVREFDSMVKIIQQEQKDLQNGKMTKEAIEQRSKDFYIPKLKRIASGLSQASLPTTDPGFKILVTYQRLSVLLIELLEMTDDDVGEAKLASSANHERVNAIQAEMKELFASIQRFNQAAAAKGPH